MSVQFGRWNLSGLPAEPEYLEKAGELLAPYGPDGEGRYTAPGVDIIYKAFHTTRESHRERQPHQSSSGAVLTWDGRLDNREELVQQLSGAVTLESPDVAIVAAAYEQWETKCLAKLIGDWALSLWEPKERTLILAKDFLGTRHLYYTSDAEQVSWSSILDPLVLLAGKRFKLEEEYIAGWLGFFPATHLTPYAGIHAVPPSTFVTLHSGRETVTKYWDFDPHKQIRYRSDREYEEHFRTVFQESVRRRLRSDSPVLAELSGGMDSSSIVCMAYRIIGASSSARPQLDTLSYYNDSEPNWNERPYFESVEERIGRTGWHIDVSANCSFDLCSGAEEPVTPAHIGLSKTLESLAERLGKRGNRVLLSGLGGDEVTGGVPTPTPELMDALARAHFRKLAPRLKAWALYQRKPLIHLLLEVLRGFFPPALVGVAEPLRPQGWIFQQFVSRYRDALSCYPTRVKLFGALPSFQENVSTLQVLRRQLTCLPALCAPLHERRYPFLDRNLLEFLYAVPRDQLVRPGQRRSLMRRALEGVVPEKALNRRRKAYVARSPALTVVVQWSRLIANCPEILSSALGIIDGQSFSKAMEKARHGQQVHVVQLMRAVAVEAWLRRAGSRLSVPQNREEQNSFAVSG